MAGKKPSSITLFLRENKMKISMKDLEMLLDHINKIAPGHELDGAYGGWKLAFVGTDGQGYRSVLSTGFTTKKDLYNNMWSYLKGLEVSK
jgi:hypothetical protein